jgi:hypothetical protein
MLERYRETYSQMLEDMQQIFLERNKLLDTILPPFIFMAANTLWSLLPALWLALGIGLLIMVVRITKRQSLLFALTGYAGILLAVLIAWQLSRAAGYFLPNIVINAAIILLGLISLIADRPVFAWMSSAAHKWPRDWYWHPDVLPAYREVTLGWGVFLLLRLLLQIYFYRLNAVNMLGTFQVLTGAPSTILLLMISYFYGVWRLKQLQGPGIEEFEIGLPPPWRGHKGGF